MCSQPRAHISKGYSYLDFTIWGLSSPYPRAIPTLPSQSENSAHLGNEYTKFPSSIIDQSSILSSPAFPPISMTSKRGKNVEPFSPLIVMNMDDFKFDKVIINNAVVLDTLVTYFDEVAFGGPN